MAHSLEVREPLMDHPLVEWLASLPSDMKIRGGESKFLLKESMAGQLPREIMYRPKMGFAVPLARWLRGPLRDRVSTALLGASMAETNLFDMEYVRELVDAHMNGRNDYSTPLWTLLMFEAFLRANLGQNRTGLAAAA